MKTRHPTAIAHALIWLPKSEIVSESRTRYNVKTYVEQNCARCEFRPDRHTDQCEECPNYSGEFKLWKEKTRKGIHYLGFPSGDRSHIASLIKKEGLKIRDLRSKPQ